MSGAGELLIGLALGASLSVPPGPMNAWIAAASTRSYRAGVTTGLGAVSADAVLGAVVYALDRTVVLGSVLPLVYALGAGVMVYFAVRLLRGRNRADPGSGDLLTFSRALALGLSNPFQVLWWLTAGVAFAYLGGAVLLVGLFGAIALWVLGFPRAVREGVRRSEKVERAVVIVSAAVLAGFAAYFGLLAVVLGAASL